MATSADQQQLISVLEDTATLLQKTQINLKKCSKARLTKGYIEARIVIIDDYWKTFRNAHQQLVKITPKDKRGAMPYFLNEEFFIYEDLYNILQGDLKDMLASLSKQATLETSFEGASQSIGHLPRILLPIFRGSYEEWPAFKDLFVSLVHSNTSLTEVQKFHYLKTSLKSEAEILVKHVQVTSNNYIKAWDSLCRRYGNKQAILNSIFKRLVYQRKMTSPSAVQMKSLLDTSIECLNSIQNLDIAIGSWDPIIIFLLVQKLDPEMHKCWEEYSYKEEADALPTWDEFKKFLESKFRSLENMVTARETKTIIKERSFHAAVPETKIKTCVLCKENHTLSHCKQFSEMETKDRSEYVKTNNLCYNCLVSGHSVSKCKVPMSCRICRRRHHSLLHLYKTQEPVTTASTSQPLISTHIAEEMIQVNTMVASQISTKQHTALLATAVVQATSEQGHTIPLRALIDPGSQATFISEKATQLLKLERQHINGTVIGVGSSRTEIKHMVQLQIMSHQDQTFRLPIQAYVMSKQITSKIPARTVTPSIWAHIQGLYLADPSYYNPGSIDLLLGVKEYAQILQPECVKGPPGTPTAQKTSLGWILFGDLVGETKSHENSFIVMHHQIKIEDMLKQLWELDLDNNRHLTQEEKRCEDIYEKTTTRNEEGRYVVKLPFKTECPQSPYGNTREIARQRFLYLERRFKKSPDLKQDYTKVIKEYIDKGYLEQVPETEKQIIKAVYLPHHAVVRKDKETSQTRVVFDASCKGTNNVSLNDELLIGPQLQEDLRNILMRWRMNCVCIIADIQKMYFQIFVNKEDADYQRILWRSDESDELKDYRLPRVSFGTASAPYLAVKTLQRVANDEGVGHPQAGKAIREDFFMDDMLSGADTVEEAISLAKDVTSILQKGGFELTKWSSNNIEFMKSIDEDKRSVNAQVDLNLDGTIKALGIAWNLKRDTFQYKFNLPAITNTVTKRSILSDIQKLFDPLGWIAPSTVLAKILIQKLWLEKASWDEEVNELLCDEWKKLRKDFENINKIEIDRWYDTMSTDKDQIEIHGFSDASMRAYAAVAYIRIKTIHGYVNTKVIAARTRVAPLKTISLPRLELCGALLLSQLLKQIGHALRIPTSQMFAWTDSQIVLAWMSGQPNRWKPFVANRVVEIAANLNNKQWYHVQSPENPADLASRGVLPSALQECRLWWSGPNWLSETEIEIKHKEVIKTDMEMKTTKIDTYLAVENHDEPEIKITSQFENFESLNELLKTITYCKKFLKYKKNYNTENVITTSDLEESLSFCIKRVQEDEFKEEREALSLKKQLKKTSKLRSLNPYLDEANILRVGGRLRHANLPESRKNPIILGKENALTLLIIAEAHHKTLHGGVQLMLCYLRSKYWILRAKSLVKKQIYKCLLCMKLNAKPRTQLMGDLPEQRVTSSRSFLHSGVDLAGPYPILMSKGRGNKTMKAYVTIFICMSTKAIHIELVSDLTSEAFIGAFKRFVARRGKCTHLWSDQGRNFIGANKELGESWNQASLQSTKEIAEMLLADGTQWHYIPAYSPNFGGLWEAGVKSIKYHLKRILTTHLTFEEMTTILCQVEACLNSRPLCPIDDTDPDNLDPLTPGHFLIGEAPIVVPSPDLENIKTHSLSRWQYTQKLLGDFWRRWQDEYLSRLQQRPKWLKTKPEFEVGDVVLIKTDNLPPGKWSMGRITDKYPGVDGCTRVYGVKSGGTITKRSITKLCALPIDYS